jgi:ketosteroid isomerase-like protein
VSDAAIQRVREVFRRWNEGERDFDDEAFDPEFTVHSTLTGRTYSGEAGVREWAAEIDEQFTDWELVIDEVTARREDLVLVVGQIRMTGRQSEVPFEQAASWAVELRDGRLQRLRNFIGHEAAAEFAESAS